MQGEVRGDRCFHCAEVLPVRPAVRDIDGVQRTFCCEGCAGAAAWIADAELGDYYRLRTGVAARVGVEPDDYSAWDRDDVLAEHAHDVAGGREITVLTDAMRCAACAWLIDRALQRESGVLDAGANAVTGRIRIAWDPGRTRLSPLLERLAALGYRVTLATGGTRERARRHERRRWLLRLGVAGLGAMQAMMLAEALYLDTAQQMPLATRDFFRWLAFLVSTPVVFFSGWPFLAGAMRELRQGHAGMDTLVATSVLLAYFASLFETVRGGTHVWYDAAVMFVFLLLVARMLEMRARNVATAQVDALARARPSLATRECADGSREQVPLAALAPGDVVRVAVGEAVPADGILLDAPAAFDESLLTGESVPVAKRLGDAVHAGTLCRDAPARLRLTRTGAQTRLSELTRLVERAQAQRPQVARLADRVASWFAVALLLAAAVVFAWWRMHEPERAFEVALAVLVVSCPCALSLAVPAALAAAHGTLARIGVLALRPEALDTLARVQRIVFDKTGTLSDAHPRIAHVQALRGLPLHELQGVAAALERDSHHPLAKAFAGFRTQAQAQDVRNVAGCGVEGNVDGCHWRLGRADWAAGRDDDGALWLGDGSHAQARFVLHEAPRPDAAVAVALLRQSGLAVGLCSGDAPAAAAALARQVGIDEVRARQTPQDKLAYVRECQARGEVVAMVGDGINDAPVLAGADVSLAMADGAALAQRAADLVVAGTSLERIPQTLALARRTRRIMGQNIAWAVGYNLLALPLAASGAVTPLLAAIGMAASSLLVTANALRLVRLPARPRSSGEQAPDSAPDARAESTP